MASVDPLLLAQLSLVRVLPTRIADKVVSQLFAYVAAVLVIWAVVTIVISQGRARVKGQVGVRHMVRIVVVAAARLRVLACAAQASGCAHFVHLCMPRSRHLIARCPMRISLCQDAMKLAITLLDVFSDILFVSFAFTAPGLRTGAS